MARDRGQRDLGEAWLSPKLGRNARLERIGAVFDWAAVEALLSGMRTAKSGRPPWPPLLVLKALLLQQWYGLSDPMLEEALSDRLSFRRFVGLALDEGAPDFSVFSRFRKALREQELDKALFSEIERQLMVQKLIVKCGTLLDATLVQAAVAKPSEPKGARSPIDPDADWTKKNGKSHFGYKAHIAVDDLSGLIRRAELTSAKVYESEIADELICGDERAVYADRAYEKKARRQALKAKGIKDRILHRRNKHQKKLPHWQAVRNKLINPIRSAVERTFGIWKRHYGYTRVRYRGLEANATHLRLISMAFNLRTAVALMG